MSDIGLPKGMTRDEAYIAGVADGEHNAEERCYNVVRFYRAAGIRRRIVMERVTLSVAQLHCSSPETSSSTAKSPAARARTRRVGAWFDG